MSGSFSGLLHSFAGCVHEDVGPAPRAGPFDKGRRAPLGARMVTLSVTVAAEESLAEKDSHPSMYSDPQTRASEADGASILHSPCARPGLTQHSSSVS